MQTTHPNVFALRNAGFDKFLYADVGAELNGSALTILSMVARLGRDPWAEAARWTMLPRAGAIESLALCIAQMPLGPSALAETRVTAARLVQLLPATTSAAWQGGASKANVRPVPGWLPFAILCCAMAFWTALSALSVAGPSPAVARPTEQPTAVHGTSGVNTVPLVHGDAVAGPAAAPSGSRGQ